MDVSHLLTCVLWKIFSKTISLSFSLILSLSLSLSRVHRSQIIPASEVKRAVKHFQHVPLLPFSFVPSFRFSKVKLIKGRSYDRMYICICNKSLRSMYTCVPFLPFFVERPSKRGCEKRSSPSPTIRHHVILVFVLVLVLVVLSSSFPSNHSLCLNRLHRCSSLNLVPSRTFHFHLRSGPKRPPSKQRSSGTMVTLR